jgi:hypothetical protein
MRHRTCVYVMAMRRGQEVIATKIGISDDPEKRRRQLETGSPFPITLEYVSAPMRRDYALDIEAAIHANMGPRLRGEWFTASINEAIDCTEKGLCAVYVDEPHPRRDKWGSRRPPSRTYGPVMPFGIRELREDEL